MLICHIYDLSQTLVLTFVSCHESFLGFIEDITDKAGIITSSENEGAEVISEKKYVPDSDSCKAAEVKQQLKTDSVQFATSLVQNMIQRGINVRVPKMNYSFEKAVNHTTSYRRNQLLFRTRKFTGR